MKTVAIVLVLCISSTLFGCAGMTETQQRTLSGGALGAGAGAIIGAAAGDALWGAAIGAAAGSAGGYLYDKNEKSKKSAYEAGYVEGQKSKP